MCQFSAWSLVIVVILEIILVLSPCHSLPTTSTGGRKGWLRICNIQSSSDISKHQQKRQHYEVEADKCPHGAWLSTPVHGDCVCLNGLWAISTSWCDEDYYVAYGKGDCFKINKKIQKLTFLGNPDDAFQPANFITTENGHVFRPFSRGFAMPDFFQTANRTVLRLRPARQSHVILEHEPTFSSLSFALGIQTDTEPVCLNTNDWASEALMIYKIRKGIKRIKVREECPKKMLSYHDPSDFNNNENMESAEVLALFPGEAVYVKSGKIEAYDASCPQDCTANFPSDTSKEDIEEYTNLIRHKRQAPPSIGQEEQAMVPEADYQPLQLDREFTDDEKDETVNAANLRVVKQELNWLLDSNRPPTIKTANWKLVQKIKEIFAKACPQAEAPKFLVDAMMRLFRLFYLQTRDYYPNGHMLEEKDLHSRLTNTLDTCLKDAQNFTINYQMVVAVSPNKTCRTSSETQEIPETSGGGGNSTNGTGDAGGAMKEVTVNTTYCLCESKLHELNLTFPVNASLTESYLLTKENLTLPPHLVFQVPTGNQTGEQHDFPTETLWKMITFTHYYCSRYFRETPADHSALMSRMENYFNEDIIYRWTRPGRNAYKVWQFLYSAFNLKKFATTVDACVAGAKYVSEYPTWMNRPTFESNRRKRRSLNQEKLPSSGSAYCLQDPWDPVYKLGIRNPRECSDLDIY